MIVSPGTYCATPIDTVRRPIRREIGKVQRADAFAQPLGIDDGAGERRIAANLDEFLAAVPAENVGRAQLLLHGERKGAQHLVAGQVVELVVVALEQVEIDDADRQRLVQRVGTRFASSIATSSARRLKTPVRSSRRARSSMCSSAGSLRQTALQPLTRPPMNTNQGTVTARTMNCSRSRRRTATS